MNLTIPASSLTLKITMTSDWHVGSGLGRGEVDRLVQRDADGLPYLPAKTLTGIVRDGCEQVALALDNGHDQGLWHRWVNFLFGDQPALASGAIEVEPCPAALSIRSAYLESSLREALKAKQQLAKAIAFIKPGVAIDEKTGSAKPDYLRFEEVVRMGAVLTAESRLDFSDHKDFSDESKAMAYALLIAGAAMVERLGGKRRRGNGRCNIKIIGMAEDREPWLQWLKEHYQTALEPPTRTPQPLSTSNPQTPDADAIWYTVPLNITTQSPVVLPRRTVGNVVESLDYIPGRYFLRHLHQTLSDKLDVSQAIAQGNLIVTNATIAIAGKAGRPTPFCLFGKKLDGGLSEGQGVYNRFQEAEPKDEQGNAIQTKGERSGYLGDFDKSRLPDYETLPLTIFTHNTIRDAVQRPTTDVGGVYSYQAIPTGTTLIAELRLPKSIHKHLANQQQNWWEALAGDLSIGQSRKDQYGGIHLQPSIPQPFQATSNAEQPGKLYVWCLSDVLLRNSHLVPTTDPDDFKRELEMVLGVELTCADERKDDHEDERDPGADNDLLSLMMRSRRTESWQVRWGLPRPSMLGWQAGSCVVYAVTNGPINPDMLAEVEARGIGDRCSEGYGQICFNDPLLMAELKGKTRNESTPHQPNPNLTPIAEGHPSFAYARIIESAAWREAIAHKALVIAANAQSREAILGIKIISASDEAADSQPKSQPPMSQLGGLRSVVLKLQSATDAEKVTNWIDAIERVSNRREKWEKTQDGLHKIRALVTDVNLTWSHLTQEVDGLDLNDFVITENGVTSLKQALWAEATRTLIDAMIRAQKRALEQAERDLDRRSQGGEAA